MKKTMSLLLALLMLLTLCPATLAAEAAAEEDAAITEAEVTAPLLGSALARDYVQSIQVDLSEPVELVEGLDGYWQTGYDGGEEYIWFSYELYSIGNNKQYTVTFTQAGAEKYNNGELTFTGQGYELEQLFSDLEDHYISYQPTMPQDMIHWETGTTYTVQLKFLDVVWQEFTVSPVPNPVEKIELAVSGPIELTEGIDGYESSYWDEKTQTEIPFFRYDGDYRSKLQYTVTFSESGAEKYGMSSFTGTRWQIGDLLGADPEWNDKQYETPWQVGGTYEAELQFAGQKMQTVTVRILPSPVASISADVPGKITLWENIDGYESSYWDEKTQTEIPFFRYDVDYRGKLQYTVTFSESGAEKYNGGKTTFTGTRWEIEELLGYWPSWANDQEGSPWQAGQTHQSTLYFMGKAWQAVQVTIEACDLTPLAAATELSWGRNYNYGEGEEPFVNNPGYISWRRNAPEQAQYEVIIYQKSDSGDDTVLHRTTWQLGALQGERGMASVDDFAMTEPNTGDYYFTVKPVGDYVSYQDGPTAISEVYHYVRPEAKLSKIPAASLTETGFVWEEVPLEEGVDGVEYAIYFSETEDGEFHWAGCEWSRNLKDVLAETVDNRWGVFGDAVAQWGNGYYYIVGRVLSSDITRWRNGDWSDPSPILNMIDNTTKIQTALEQITADAAPEEVREAVQALDTDLLWETMAADQDNTGVMEQLAQLEEQVGGPAKVEVDTVLSEAFGGDKVSVVGANLNTPTDGAQDITLQIGKPHENHVLSELYDSTLAVKFSMELTNTDSTELAVPVKIVLPVPENINPRFLVILHYPHDGGEPEELCDPYIFTEGGQKYVSFVLTSFSDFALTAKIYDPCDLNLDDVVNVLDMQALYDLLAQDMEPKSGSDYCDTNGDGSVNILDYQFIYEQLRSMPHGGGSVVIEPSPTGAAGI